MLSKGKFFHILSGSAVILAVFVSAVGLFDQSAGVSSEIVNQYGDVVKLYGSGLYKDDSFFRAPIFRGTDFVVLFLVCPLVLFAAIQDIRKNTVQSRVKLVSLLGVLLYYAASIAFGIKYNWLHLAYILFFSISLFSLVTGMISIGYQQLTRVYYIPFKGVYVFLSLTGIALVIAWLPDIITALEAGRSLLMIEHYTTEITYVLDMGVIAPLCFICIGCLVQRTGMGLVLLDLLLTLCIVIGVMLPVQMVFQVQKGIVLPVPVLITKVAVFCLLASFALYFKVRCVKALNASLHV